MPVNWNPKTRTFERDGKSIPPASIREFILQTVENAKSRMKSIAEGYTSHRNSAELYTTMRTEIRAMHTALAMVAQGGREQMDAKAWGQVGQKVKSELEYLRGFERDVANGSQSDAQVLARAIQYSEAGYKTYQNMVMAREKEFGTAFARRILNEGAEHCDDCPSLATEEFLPITEVAEIGASSCGSRCHCEIQFADAEAA